MSRRRLKPADYQSPAGILGGVARILDSLDAQPHLVVVSPELRMVRRLLNDMQGKLESIAIELDAQAATREDVRGYEANETALPAEERFSS